MINIQWTKFERKSIVSFISEELPQSSKHTDYIETNKSAVEGYLISFPILRKVD